MTKKPDPGPARPSAPARGGLGLGDDSDGDGERLVHLLGQAVEQVDRILGLEGGGPADRGSYAQSYRTQLAILRALLGLSSGRLEPEPDPHAPLGWRFPRIEEQLGLDVGGGIAVLEDLADLGLLKRELAGHVHVCTGCGRFHINYRETCPGCASIDNEIERLLHHFHCAYTGLESEFTHGVDLVCPRCRRRLFQLGQDFDCPHDTYVCHDCRRIFEEPDLQALCLACGLESAARDTRLVRLYRYGATPLTVRAVELNRLTGLEVSEIMFDTRVRLATRDFLLFEIERELQRARRYGGSFSVVRLTFAHGEAESAIFRDWHADTILELGRMLTSALRPLDLVARYGQGSLVLFLPETDESGSAAVERRLATVFEATVLATRDGRALAPRWQASSWTGEATIDGVRAFLGEGEGQE